MQLTDINLVFLATFAAVFLCRIIGLLLGNALGGRPKLQKLVEELPACALSTVVALQVLSFEMVELIAFASGTIAFILGAGLLTSFIGATALLIGLASFM